METYDPTKARDPAKLSFFTYLCGGIRHDLHCYLSKARRGHHNFTWVNQMKNASFNGETDKKGFSFDDLWQIHLDINSYDEPLVFETRRKGELFKQQYTKSAFSSKVLNTLNAKRFQEPSSLDSLMDSEEPADLSGWRPDKALEEKELTFKLKNLLLSLLGDRVRLILTARYGLNFFPDEIKALGFEPGISYNNAAIGRKIELTKERVRQLKDKCLKRFEIKVRRDVLRTIVEDYWFDKCSLNGSDKID